jgi:hypothetical protein
MTDKQINIAIAKACGWEEESFGPSWYESSSKMPDYCNDLNAMHEAEKIFDHALYCRYINELCDITIKGNNSMYMATASQRAEAFLKTINKWKD